MGVYILDVYRSSNIGIFLKVNEKNILIPKGLAKTKSEKLSTYLGVEPLWVSVNGSRLLGPLVALNNKGILVSRLTLDEEIAEMRRGTGLVVERLPSRYTCVGNLVVANDRGALVSSIFDRSALKVITDVLDVSCTVLDLGSYVQIGSMVVATNLGVIAHPSTSEEELSRIRDILKVDAEPGTINRGVPFVAAGIVANSRGAVVGNLTSGTELVIVSRALKL